MNIPAGQLPKPTVIWENDQKVWSQGPFRTLSGDSIPLASSQYIAIDEGNCSPRFLRPSLYGIPSNEALLATSCLPFTLTTRPCAPLGPNESLIPGINVKELGPLRCSKCLAYANPYTRFVNYGKSMICNICGIEALVPEAYFCNADATGRRLDQDSHPEFKFGTVDFIVDKEFIDNPYEGYYSVIFNIDVGRLAVADYKRFSLICSTIAEFVKDLMANPAVSYKVGLVTMDTNVHFYKFAVGYY